MAAATAVGIDLGTTYSAIAYVNQHGKSEIIPNREGERITPSVVLINGDEAIVGTMAKRTAVSAPFSVCQLVKRQMGEKHWRFLAENDKEYTAEAISALILRRLLEDAEAVLGHKVTDAVITVPAYFNDAQRRATQDAGEIAGLKKVRLINEPTAAALAYGLDRSDAQTVMVYDLGGGTFDVTIMELEEEGMRVIATGGDKNLGGFDWDNKVMSLLNDRFERQLGESLLVDAEHEQDLRDKSEIAKKTLSTIAETKVFLSTSGKNASLTISREEFEEVTADLIERTRDLVEMTLEDARLDWSRIDKVLLAGGSTRMRSVPEMIKQMSGRLPSFELHPDEVVASGAALLAAQTPKTGLSSFLGAFDATAGREITLGKIVDVNSHSLGAVALRGNYGSEFNSIILPRNTPVRTRVSETYFTVIDNQTRLDIEVTEGEVEDLEHVRVIGTSTVNIPPYPMGAPIEIFFEFDESGMIDVTVHDKTANRPVGDFRVRRESNRTEREKEAIRREVNCTAIC